MPEGHGNPMLRNYCPSLGGPKLDTFRLPKPPRKETILVAYLGPRLTMVRQGCFAVSWVIGEASGVGEGCVWCCENVQTRCVDHLGGILTGTGCRFLPNFAFMVSILLGCLFFSAGLLGP